jgi:hypothetical protein
LEEKNFKKFSLNLKGRKLHERVLCVVFSRFHDLLTKFVPSFVKKDLERHHLRERQNERW